VTEIKTGEVYDRDEEGNLWLCESFQNPETGEVRSTRTPVDDQLE
jgi:hypothetical protein